MKKNQTTVSAGFLITRNSLIYFANNLDGVMPIGLSVDIMEDLEIISEASLERVLLNWIDQYKLQPGKVALILDRSVYFDATLPQLPIGEDDQNVQQFLLTVPFHEVLTKSFTLKSGAALIAVNQQLVKPLMSSLEKVGFVVLSVVPDFVLQLNIAQTPLSKESVEQILAQPELFESFNMLPAAEVAAKMSEPETFLSVKFDVKLIAMIGIFAVLIVVLVLLLVMRPK